MRNISFTLILFVPLSLSLSLSLVSYFLRGVNVSAHAPVERQGGREARRDMREGGREGR